MKKYLFLLFLFAGSIQASPFAKGNAGNGKKLFAKYECSIGATLTEHEKQDLAAHLNQTYYHFK